MAETRTLYWYFPTAHKKTRVRVAEVIRVLSGGAVEDTANASGVLRDRLRDKGVRVESTQLATILKKMEDEGLLSRRINGKRTLRLALTDAGAAVDITGVEAPEHDPRAVPTAGVDKRLTDLQDHFRSQHAETWELLNDEEKNDVVRLGRLDGRIHERSAEGRDALTQMFDGMRVIERVMASLQPAQRAQVVAWVAARHGRGSET